MEWSSTPKEECSDQPKALSAKGFKPSHCGMLQSILFSKECSGSIGAEKWVGVEVPSFFSCEEIVGQVW